MTSTSARSQTLDENSSRNWWKTMKALMGQKSEEGKALCGLAIETIGGKMDDLVNSINDFLTSITENLPRLTQNHWIFNPGENAVSLPSQYTISVDEVEKALASVKTNKATGPDQIGSLDPQSILTRFSLSPFSYLQ